MVKKMLLVPMGRKVEKQKQVEMLVNEKEKKKIKQVKGKETVASKGQAMHLALILSCSFLFTVNSIVN